MMVALRRHRHQCLPVILVVTLDEIRCGHSHHCPSIRHKMSNELSFIAIIPTNLLFYANLTAINFALAVDMETGMNIPFSFIVLTNS